MFIIFIIPAVSFVMASASTLRPEFRTDPKRGCFEGECGQLVMTCEYPAVNALDSITIYKSHVDNYRDLIELSTISSKNQLVPKDTCGLVNATTEGDIGITRDKAWLSITWREPTRDINGKYVCKVILKESCGKVKETFSKVLVTIRSRESTALQNVSLEQLAKDERILEQEVKNLAGQLEAMSHKPNQPSNSNAKSPGAAVASSLVTESEPDVRNHTYYLSEFLMTGNGKSEAICNSLGGYLAEIDDENEFVFIKQFLREHISPSQIVLIGGTDKEKEGDWIFPRTNQKVPLLDWANNQPAGGDEENCLSLVMNAQTSDIKMNDWPCLSVQEVGKPWQYTFLCEMEHNGTI